MIKEKRDKRNIKTREDKNAPTLNEIKTRKDKSIPPEEVYQFATHTIKRQCKDVLARPKLGTVVNNTKTFLKNSQGREKIEHSAKGKRGKSSERQEEILRGN